MTSLLLRDLRSPFAAVRWGGTLLAALALAMLAAIGPLSAHAATTSDSYNQMTGIGTTASAITVNWTNGLLNSQNQPITNDTTDLSPNSDRTAYAANPASATSKLSFMYGDFKNLQVTVSQTQNITHQGITVSWTGGQQSSAGAPFDNFLQMMECYGDSANGPSPENCQYGSLGPLGAGVTNPWIGSRVGYNCAGASPSTNPASTPMGPYGDASMGCDPFEPGSETPAHCDPNAVPNQQCAAPADFFSIPFVPADDPANPIYGQSNLPQVFDQFNTNEVQVAYTAADGTGQRQFETLTAKQSPGLGCGETESNGQTRNCWLVIVPRGSYEPNGYQVSPTASGLLADGRLLNTSPLSAGNWAQRIQVHLGYAPLTPDCPTNVVPDQMVGTQVISRAVTSWQESLNQAAHCSRLYSYTATTESEATGELAAGGAGQAGLAFTTIPIGSEAARDGVTAPKLPKILYAPVAITALDFGFNINEASYLTTPVKLTPALVAKALTQVYLSDLPDYYPDHGLPGPTWAQGNPLNITFDQEFQKLNPTSLVRPLQTKNSVAPLVIGDLSSDSQRTWQWIQSDPATSSWLDGGTNTGDPVAADPDSVKLQLGKPPADDSFPEAYTGKITCSQVVTNVATECGTKAGTQLNVEALLPVADNYDQAAATVLAASDSGLTKDWNSTAKDSAGNPGWWGSIGTELVGQTFMWTANDMPDLASYGLISAALCNPSGSSCVQPSVSDVTAALGSATKDSAGLLQVNPAKVKAGAYPLVEVVYAAVATNQPAAALSDYADLISYAAGQGQATGSAPGDLPPGYLPLTSSLKTQAQSVVKQLRAIANPTGTPTHPATSTQTRQGNGSQPSSQSQVTPATQSTTTPGGAGNGPGSNATPNPTAATPVTPTSTVTSGTPSSSASGQGPVTLAPAANPSTGTTPRTSVGGIREALVIVGAVGGAGGLGGFLLRYGQVPSFRLFRRRTGGL